MRATRTIIIAGIVVAIGAAILVRRGSETNTNGNTNSNVNATIAPASTNSNVNAVVNTNTTASTNGNQNTNTASNVNAGNRVVATAPTFDAELRPDAVTATSPAHRSRLTSLPLDLSVTFQRAVSGTPTLSIRRDGTEYGTGDVATSNDQMTIRRGVSSAASDGLYTVNYYACFAAADCVTGHFQFSLE